MHTHFDRMYERDKQTDRETHRHTDGHRMTAKAVLDASGRQKVDDNGSHVLELFENTTEVRVFLDRI